MGVCRKNCFCLYWVSTEIINKTILLKRAVYRYNPFDKRPVYRHVDIINRPICYAHGIPQPSLFRGGCAARCAIDISAEDRIAILLLHFISWSYGYAQQFRPILATRYYVFAGYIYSRAHVRLVFVYYWTILAKLT